MRNALAGRTVLILEDEYLLASALQDAVEQMGAMVIGPFSRVQQALQSIDDGHVPDVGLLDVNLGSEYSYPLADLLAERGIPTVLITGYDTSALPEAYRSLSYLRKPFDLASITSALDGLKLKPGDPTH
jgi:DNA-binding NtrC family response regulator